MKRGTLLVVQLLALAANAKAVLVFDNFDPFASTGTFVGVHDVQGGDRMVLPDPGAGNMWLLNSFTGHMGASAAGTYFDVTATLTIYRTVFTSGSGPAFADPMGSSTQNLGSFFASGAGIGPDFTMTALNIALSAPPSNAAAGYGVHIVFSASGPGVVVPHYRNQQSTVPGSSSSQGWYRDVDDSGLITADEYEVFAPWADGNLTFELDATAVPVPAPAPLLSLLFPLGLMAVRRRRRVSPQE
jgi:hypothetical protein